MSYVRLNGVWGAEITGTTGTSVPSGTFTDIESFTLDAGVWVVACAAQFTANATGRRIMNLSTGSASTSTSAAAATTAAAVSGAQTTIMRTYLLNLSAQTTYHLNVYQNSGSALTTYHNIRYARIR